METTDTSGPGARAGRREMIGLAVLGLPTIMISLDRNVLYLVLPHLSTDLHAGSLQQLWITDIHEFMLAGLLITMGTVGDRIGRRRLLLLGAAGFMVAAAVAAYSTSPQMLIAARTLLGVAAATLMPSAIALISGMFRDPRQNRAAFAVWMGFFMLGTAFGPLLAGLLLERFWWGSVFLLGVPFMGLFLLLAPRLLPEFRNPDAGRIDLASVALSLAAILPIIYGLKELSRDGLAAGSVLAVAVGAAVGLVFLRRQRALDDPLLDLGLFRSRTFSSALALTVFAGVMGGVHVFVYMYLQLVEGLSPLRTAAWLLPSMLSTVVSLQLVPLLVRRIRPAYAIAGGMLLQAPGYLMLTRLDGDGDLPLLVTGLVTVAVGVGPLAALGVSLVVQSAPPERAGSAGSMTETSGQFGIAIGVAGLGMVGTAVYRAQMADQVVPGLPPEAADAARESVTGALGAAGGLSGPAAADLLGNAYDALASGLNAAAGISALLSVVAAVLAVTALRHVPPSGREPGPKTDRDGGVTAAPLTGTAGAE